MNIATGPLRGQSALEKKIAARIRERGWTYGHVIAVCEFCKKSRDLGANGTHTAFFLSDVLDGYWRGLEGLNRLDESSYEFVSGSPKPEHYELWSIAALQRRPEVVEKTRKSWSP